MLLIRKIERLNVLLQKCKPGIVPVMYFALMFIASLYVHSISLVEKVSMLSMHIAHSTATISSIVITFPFFSMI